MLDEKSKGKEIVIGKAPAQRDYLSRAQTG
jgi:hypothetical protein